MKETAANRESDIPLGSGVDVDVEPDDDSLFDVPSELGCGPVAYDVFSEPVMGRLYERHFRDGSGNRTEGPVNRKPLVEDRRVAQVKAGRCPEDAAPRCTLKCCDPLKCAHRSAEIVYGRDDKVLGFTSASIIRVLKNPGIRFKDVFAVQSPANEKQQEVVQKDKIANVCRIIIRTHLVHILKQCAEGFLERDVEPDEATIQELTDFLEEQLVLSHERTIDTMGAIEIDKKLRLRLCRELVLHLSTSSDDREAQECKLMNCVNAECERIKKEKESLEQECSDLRRQIAQLKDEKDSEVKALSAQAELEQHCSCLEKDIKTLTEEKTLATSRLQEAQSRVQELSSQVAETKHHLVSMEKRLANYKFSARHNRQHLQITAVEEWLRTSQPKDGDSIIHLAAEEGRAEVVDALLLHGHNKNARGCNGWTPLHYAAAGGHIEVVQKLMKHGTNKNPVSAERGATPLHWAAMKGMAEVVRCLLQQGADKSAKDKEGGSPLHWAARKGEVDVIQLLLHHGVNINAKDNIGETPLHWAVKQGKLNGSQCLVQHGANINAHNHDGDTPLHWAAICGQIEVGRHLVQNGASIHIRNNRKERPKDVLGKWAIMTGSEKYSFRRLL